MAPGLHDKTSAENPMIRIKNLNVSFADKKIIEDLNLTVKKNEFLYITGKNGSGKSTLANVMLGIIPGLIPADVSGDISIRGQIGVVLQNPESQFISMSVKEELEDYDTKNDKYDLSDIIDKSVFEISYGQKQKVNLISNLMQKKNILILDEPLELLSPEEVRRFIKIIKKIAGKKTIVWFDKNEKYAQLSDRIIRISSQDKINPIKKNHIQKHPNTGQKIIYMKNVCFLKEGFCLDGLDFSVSKGEKIAVIGDNGSGKSTMLKLIAGFLDYRGNIEIAGKEAKKQKLCRLISYSPQNPVHLFFEENLRKEIVSAKYARKFRLLNLLDRNPSDLSKGQQKIASIAVADSFSKDVLLLDEPTTWLDEYNTDIIQRFLMESDKTIILATHDPKIIQFCDRIYLIRNGGLRECSNTEAEQYLDISLK